MSAGTAQTHGTPTPARASRAAFDWRMPSDWWLKKTHYFMYMMRELSAVFAALWVVLFLAQIPAMASGGTNLPAFVKWLDFIHSPGWVVFSMVALVFVLYHAFTWFNLMGTVLYVRMGKTPMPGSLIIGAMFAVWLGVSIIIYLIIYTPQIGG